MDTLRETRDIAGIGVTCYKQSGTHILCKVLITPSDSLKLCERTRSGLFKNKEFHERFINKIITQLDILNTQEKEKINGKQTS